MDFPDTLYLLDPDWGNCEYIWLPKDLAQEAIADLRQMWSNVSLEACSEFWLNDDNGDGTAQYMDPSGYHDPVTLKLTTQGDFRQVS
jgi:hypothetical protein